MEYGERSRGDLLAHTEVRLWAVEEHLKGNYLKSRKIHKAGMKMREKYMKHRKITLGG